MRRMERYQRLFSRFTNWNRTDRLKIQLKEYVDVTFSSLWSRQLIYIAALLISAYYFDPIIAVITITAVEVAEIIDVFIARKIINWADDSPGHARLWLIFTAASALLSSMAVAAFILAIAIQQESGGHFTPLFFLIAASLFAAMNNHQLPIVLALRLTVYGLAFLIIAFLDIYRLNPPLSSPVWLEFFTTLFAMYFIIGNSLVFFRLYRSLQSKIREIERKQRETKVAYKAKSQFVSNLSHELKTPLTAINGSLGLAVSGNAGELPGTVARLLEVAERKSKHLAALVNDLFDVQAMEADELILDQETINLRELVDESVEKYKTDAEKSGIKLISDIPAQDVWIRGDHGRVAQVMASLLSNAIKFSSEGAEVNVALKQSPRTAFISVTDTGVGIPEGSEDAVFGYFGQVDSSDRRQVGGSGLGLYIAKMIVEKHGGKIHYSSELGKGTVFLVELGRVDYVPTHAPDNPT